MVRKVQLKTNVSDDSSRAAVQRGGCPNCGAGDLTAFYRVKNVPVHSVLLMSAREEALAYPRRDIELGYCGECGFITNREFDPSVHEYSTRYEETQGFSETFSRFARSLAARLIDRYDVHGKTVLEVGCGKGEFLELLCELGDNRGIGVDPAFVPERMTHLQPGRIEFIQDFFSQRYAHLKADFICCRHTLEHIGPTREFVLQIRSAIADRKNALVFFELPDVLRVLREGALWDIYYEHCSYFSRGSLARLFEACGFEVLDLELDYHDQYILIAAVPNDSPARRGGEVEADLEALRNAVAEFPRVCGETMRKWQATLQRIQDAGERCVIWGGGSKGVAFLTTLGIDKQIEYVVDVNPHKQGMFMPGSGHPVVAPEFLADYHPDHVIAMNPVYCGEIQEELDRLNVRAQLHAI